MTQTDIVIIGGGHNGLVCAWYLARHGLKVTVLERRHVVGGAAVTEEFHPGFRNSTASYTVSLLRPKVIADMRLADYGYRVIERTISNFFPFPDTYLKLGGAPGRTEAEFARFLAETGDVQDGAVCEGFQGAHGMDAADEAAHPFQGVGAVEFRHAPAPTRIYGETEAGVIVQAGAVGQNQGGYHRDFPRREFQRESMFLQDCGIGPATGPIELRHHRRAFFPAHLVDPVLVTVQSQQSPVGPQAHAIQRGEHSVGGEMGIGGHRD